MNLDSGRQIEAATKEANSIPRKSKMCLRRGLEQFLDNFKHFWTLENDKRPGSRGFKKLSEFGNSSLQGHESSQMLNVLG